jgi:mono/diheme cytochrome c family protein
MRFGWHAVFASILAGSASLVACGGADLGDCPSDSAAKQAQGLAVMEAQCNRCHSSALSGAALQDAPEEYNFDDPSVVKEEAAEMYGESEEGAMPPDATLGADDLEALRVYLACTQ